MRHYQEAKQDCLDKRDFVNSAWLLQHVEYDADPLQLIGHPTSTPETGIGSITNGVKVDCIEILGETQPGSPSLVSVVRSEGSEG